MLEKQEETPSLTTYLNEEGLIKSLAQIRKTFKENPEVRTIPVYENLLHLCLEICDFSDIMEPLIKKQMDHLRGVLALSREIFEDID